MNYWPMSLLRGSPMMPGAFQYELENAHKHGLSSMAESACFQVAVHTRAMQLPNAVPVVTTDSAVNFLFLDYPHPEEIEKLEQCAFFEFDGALYSIAFKVH